MPQIARDKTITIGYVAPAPENNVSHINVEYTEIIDNTPQLPIVVPLLHVVGVNSVLFTLVGTVADSVNLRAAFCNASGCSAFSEPPANLMLPVVPVPSVPSGLNITVV